MKARNPKRVLFAMLLERIWSRTKKLKNNRAAADRAEAATIRQQGHCKARERPWKKNHRLERSCSVGGSSWRGPMSWKALIWVGSDPNFPLIRFKRFFNAFFLSKKHIFMRIGPYKIAWQLFSHLLFVRPAGRCSLPLHKSEFHVVGPTLHFYNRVHPGSPGLTLLFGSCCFNPLI